MVSLSQPGPPGRRKPDIDTVLTAMPKSDYRSTCTICRLGIYGREGVWVRGAAMDLVHADPCASTPGVTVVERQPAPVAPACPKPEQKVAAKPRPTRTAPVRSYRSDLTERQTQMLQLVADGCTDTEIGDQLGVGRGTVSNTLRDARVRLDADTVLAAVDIAVERGLIHADRKVA